MTTIIPSQTVTRTPPRFVLTPKLKTAITMTALTLLGLITGLLGEHTLDNEYVKWGGYALAYLAGGIPAGREALHSLFVERKLDVDLLMVLADRVVRALFVIPPVLAPMPPLGQDILRLIATVFAYPVVVAVTRALGLRRAAPGELELV